MTINLQTLAKNTFKGKIFKSSEFNEEIDGGVFTAYGKMVALEEFNPFGKRIVDVEIGMSSSCEDVGLLFTFEGYHEPFFFYSNDDIEVE